MNAIAFDWKDQFRYDYQHIRQDHVDEIICWITKYIIGPLPPKEPKDERSVARDDDQGGEAGNKKITEEGQQTTSDVEHGKEWVETIEVAIIRNIEQGMVNLPLNDYTSRMACLRAIEQVKMLAGAKWNQGKEASQPITTPSGSNSVTNTSDNP